MLSFIVMFFCSISGFAQVIKGKVTDAQKQPLPGVTIMLKGTTSVGTITDFDGNYNLKINDLATDVIIASFIGMETQEIAVKGRNEINIEMEEAHTQLDEVVAVGYGTVKKRDITGSVTSVKGDDLKATPVSDAVQAMQGKMAGVQIMSTEGSPDADMTIKVRGGGSVTQDNSPLLIVDGFPVSSLSDIPAADIESIDVLKDASSTAIYGSRGANGVIIVTTKSGKAGKTTVSFNSYYGVSKIAKTLDVLDPYDYVNWQYEYDLLSSGDDEISTSYTDYFGNYQDIDLYKNVKGNNWQDQIYGRTGNVACNDISIRGGSEKITYSLSYANFNQKAIMMSSDFVRNNASFKLNAKPNDKIKISFSTRYSDTRVNGGGSTDATSSSANADSRLKQSVLYSPIPVDGLTSNDDTDESTSSNLINPVTAVEDNEREKTTKKFNVSGSFSWEILNNLKFKSDIGLDTYDYVDNRFYGLSTYFSRTDATYTGNPAAKFVAKKRQKIRNTNTLNYDFKDFLPQDHSLSLLLGEELINGQSETITSVIENYPEFFTAEQAFNLSSQGINTEYDDYHSADDRLLSFFGRANYSYQSKYMFSFTFRSDGSSKFGDGNKWGYFPSAALAWRVSSENFMQGTKGWLDDLKLRLSYGTAGNNNIPADQIITLYSSSTINRINDVTNIWSTGTTMANSDLTWETTVTRNVGIDFTMLNSRLSGTIDGYYNTTTDLLINFDVSGVGYTSQYRNMGETENKGLEFSLNWVAVDKSNFGLNFGFNIGFNKNKIKSLGMMDDFNEESGWSSTDIGEDYAIRKGGSVGDMYGYKSDGRYELDEFENYSESEGGWVLKTDEEGNSVAPDPTSVLGNARPGLMKVKDKDGDNAITTDDKQVIGNAMPDATGGFNISGRVYNFDFSAVFNYSIGNDVYNANKIQFTTATGSTQYFNMISEMESGKRWTNLDPETGAITTDKDRLQELNEGTTMWSPYMQQCTFTDWAVEDGSFLRLGTFTVGYTLPKSLLSKYKIDKIRFYATGSNLFCLSNYSGYDPEASTRRKTYMTPGVDYSAYPRARQVVVGLNLNF